MTPQDFESVKRELEKVAASEYYVLKWGMKQNDEIDALLSAKFFDIMTFDELLKTVDEKLAKFTGYMIHKEKNTLLSENELYEKAYQYLLTLNYKDIENTYNGRINIKRLIKRYYVTRWSIRMVSLCDEFLFCQIRGVSSNNNPKSKRFDIHIARDGVVKHYDLKDTVIGRKCYSGDEEASAIIRDPSHLTKEYFLDQSDGKRYGHQNRLFILHHSFARDSRHIRLRIDWDKKIEAFNLFVDKIENVKETEYNGCYASFLTIFEDQKYVRYSRCYFSEN